MTPVGKYGPAVIGEDQYEKEQEIIREQGEGENRFGPAITEDLDQVDGLTTVHADEAEDVAERLKEKRLEAAAEGGEEEGEVEWGEDDLPPGYEIEGGQGGYYILYGPDGEQIEGSTESGRWGPGKEKAIQAAAIHFEEQAKQAEADEAGSASEQVSVDELRGIMANSPTKRQVDNFLHREVDRPSGPRLEAVQVLLDAEQAFEEPRSEVVSTLEALQADLLPEE